MLIFLLIFLTILIGRHNTFLIGYEILNIDESQMMANAIRLEKNGYNIFEFDGTSSGFLNSLTLNWPNLFGLDVTFLSTRITAIIIISLIFLCCYFFFRTEINKKFSLLLISPSVILLAFTHDPDFTHYSSELLSTFFIIICLYGYKLYSKTKKTFFLYLGTFLISLIIFSKTQIIPTAAVLVFSIVFFNMIEKNFKIAINCAFLFLTPILLIFSIFAFKGFLYDYYLNYFEFSKAVVSKYSIGENINSGNTGNSVNDVSFNKYKDYFLLNSVFHFFYFQLIISFFLFLISLIKKNYKRLFNFSFLLIIICIVSVSLSILVTGALYRHYFFPLVPLSTLFVGSIYIVIKEKFLNLKFYKYSIYFLIFIFLFSFVFESEKFYSKKHEKIAFNLEELNFHSPKLLDFLQPQNRSLYIWGWHPQLYVLSNLYPSGRATISQKNIEDFSNKEYFNERLLVDLKEKKPDIILDYVKPKSFLYTDTSKGIKNSILNELIKTDYVNIESGNLNCPDLYIEKNSHSKLINKLINFYSKDPRLTKLNNFSITKEICDDSVVFDSSYEDNIVLKLDQESKITTILILASHLNDKETKMNFKLVNEKEIFSDDIILKKYPFWTKISIANDNLVNEIILDISNLKKLTYGINEIKIY